MTNQENVAPERNVKEFCFKALAKVTVKNGIKKVAPDTERYTSLASSPQFGLLFVANNNGFEVVRTVDLYNIDDSHKQDKHLTQVTDYPSYVSVVTPSTPVYIGVSCNGELLAVVYDVQGGCQMEVYAVTKFANTVTPVHSIHLSTSTNACLRDAKWNPAVPTTIAVCLSDGSATMLDMKDTSFTIVGVVRECGVTALCWSPKGKQIVLGCVDGSLLQMDLSLTAIKKRWPPPGPDVYAGRPCRVLDVLWESTYTFIVAYLPHTPEEREQPNIAVVSVPPKEGQPSYVNFEDMCYSSGSSTLPKCFLNYIPAWGLCVVGLTNSLEMSLLCKNTESKRWERWTVDDNGRAELPMDAESNDTYPLGLTVDFTSTKPIPLGDNLFHLPSPCLWLLSNDASLVPFYLIHQTADTAQLMVQPTQLPASSVAPAQPRAASPVTATSTPIAPRQFSFTPHTPPTPPPQGNVYAVGANVGIPPSFNLGPSSTGKATPPPNISVAPRAASHNAPEPPKAPIVASVQPTIPSATQPTQREAPVTSESERPADSNINRVVDSEFTQCIHDEINHFEAELRDLYSRGRGFESIGTREELENLERRTAAVTQFSTDMCDTTKDQRSEVEEAKSGQLDLFSMVTEGCTRMERNKDPAYVNLLRTQGLSLESSEQLSQLESTCRYIENGIRDVQMILDTQWRNTVQNRRNNNGRLPFADSTYRTLKMNQNIAARQRAVLDRLHSKVDQIHLGASPSKNWTNNPTAYTASSSLRDLADSFREATPEKTSPPVTRPKVISPARETQMRNFFLSRPISRVKPAKPDERSASRLLSSLSRLRTSTATPHTPVSTATTPTQQPPATRNLASTPITNVTPIAKPTAHNITKNLFGSTQNDTTPKTIPSNNPQNNPPNNQSTSAKPLSTTIPPRQTGSSTPQSSNQIINGSTPINKNTTPSQAFTNKPPISAPQSAGFSFNSTKPSTTSSPAAFSFTTNKTNVSFASNQTSPFNFSTNKTAVHGVEANKPTFGNTSGSFSALGQNTRSTTPTNTNGSFSAFGQNARSTTPTVGSKPASRTATPTIPDPTNQTMPQMPTLTSLLADDSVNTTTEPRPADPPPQQAQSKPAAISLGFKVTPNTSFTFGAKTEGAQSVFAKPTSSLSFGKTDQAADSNATTRDKPSIFSAAAAADKTLLSSAYSGVKVSAATIDAPEGSDSTTQSLSSTSASTRSDATSSSSYTSTSSTSSGATVDANQTDTNRPDSMSDKHPIQTNTDTIKTAPFGVAESTGQKPIFGATSALFGKDSKSSVKAEGGFFSAPSTEPNTSLSTPVSSVLGASITKVPVQVSDDTETEQEHGYIPKTEKSTSIFGQSTTPKTFGSSAVFGQTSQNSDTPTMLFGKSAIFGQATSTTASVSSSPLFGQASTVSEVITTASDTTTATPTIFGQTSATSSIFDQSSGAVFGQTTNTGAVFGTSTTTAASTLFGKPTSVASSRSSASPTLFGQVTQVASSTPSQATTAPQTASIFGQPTTTTPSIFGQSSTTPSIFGQVSSTSDQQPTTASIFGQTPTTTSSIFGQPASTTGSIFGAQSTSTPSIFGQPTATTTSSIFGQQPTTTATIFGQPTSTTSSVFGQPTSTPATTFGQTAPLFGQSTFGQTSIFGGSTPTTTTSTAIFGQNSTSNELFSQTTSSGVAKNLFGGPVSGASATAFSGSGGGLFGKSSTSEYPKTFSQLQPGLSVFGQTSGFPPPAFGQQSQTSQASSPFGQSTGFLGGLGGQASTENANKNVFGDPKPTTFASPNTSIFGAAPSGQGAFGSFGSSSLGAGVFSQGASGNIASSGFGVAAGASPVQSGFGAPAVFGSSPIQPSLGFGQTSAPAFGSASTDSSHVFGQQTGGAPGSPTFGSLAQNTSPSFGTAPSFGAAPAVQSPTFGSPAFGAPANPGFGASPAFGGGSAFTGHRG